MEEKLETGLKCTETGAGLWETLPIVRGKCTLEVHTAVAIL